MVPLLPCLCELLWRTCTGAWIRRNVLHHGQSMGLILYFLVILFFFPICCLYRGKVPQMSGCCNSMTLSQRFGWSLRTLPRVALCKTTLKEREWAQGAMHNKPFCTPETALQGKAMLLSLMHLLSATAVRASAKLHCSQRKFNSVPYNLAHKW